MKNIRYKKDVKNRTGLMLFLLFTCFTLCLSVGYAALNSDLKISGEASFRVESDIRITDVSLYETTNLGLENYKSKYSKDTITIGAKLTQVNSTTSYKVKVQNSGTVAMWIDSIEEEAKNNSNTEYVLEGIGLKELISPGEEKEFIIKIKYKDSITILPDNTNLDTILKFNFIKPESILVNGNYGSVGSYPETKVFDGPIMKKEIESIEFRPMLDVIDDAIGSWDASYDKNGTVIASYKDSDGNGLYELYIGGIGKVYFNKNSSYLFRYFTNLKTIDLSYVDTSNTTGMAELFSNCGNLTSVDMSSFDTSNVVNMNNMFYACPKLLSVNLTSFDTSNVTGMEGMFCLCSKLNKLDLSNFNTSKVTSMKYMFYNCFNLSDINLSNFDTLNVENMMYMFQNCRNLMNIDVSSFDTSNVTNMVSMFNYCSQLKSLNLSNFNTSKVENMESMFIDCSSLVNLDISSFNTAKVTNMQNMFNRCYLLENISLLNFDTSSVTDMSSMFTSCKSLTELNLQSFNTSNVITMKGMFWNCQKLTNLNISSFDTSKVTDMRNMFQGCLSIEELDLTNFDTSNVTSMGAMFYQCYKLGKLDLSTFVFKDDVTSSNMFYQVPISALIYVKDDSSKEFIIGVRSDLKNVQIKEV